MSAASVRVLVPIADGSEEIETVCIADTLVRAGAAVTICSVSSDTQVTCSRGVKIVADEKIDTLAAKEWDAIAIPGGMPGAKNIAESAPFVEILKSHVAAGKLTGAVCAAPAVVLAGHGLIPADAACTSHPGFAEKLAGFPGGCSEQRVVISGNIVTSRGPGTSIEFALALAAKLFGDEKSAAVAGPMLVK